MWGPITGISTFSPRSLSGHTIAHIFDRAQKRDSEATKKLSRDKSNVADETAVSTANLVSKIAYLPIPSCLAARYFNPTIFVNRILEH